MLIANHKPICLIGFEQSTILQECRYFVESEFLGKIITITPTEFFALPDKDRYQFAAAFTLDTVLRRTVIDTIALLKLDCITFIHDTVVCYDTRKITDIIGIGSFVSPFSTILLNATLGKHCVVETYCLISHYSEVGENSVLHSGVMIAGKTKIGANSVFNFKSAALNALTLCVGVEVGACSTITKDITVPGYYVGTPARRISSVKEFNV